MNRRTDELCILERNISELLGRLTYHNSTNDPYETGKIDGIKIVLSAIRALEYGNKYDNIFEDVENEEPPPLS